MNLKSPNRASRVARTVSIVSLIVATTEVTGPHATAADAVESCGIHTMAGPHGPFGEILDLTDDGVYVGATGAEQFGPFHSTWWDAAGGHTVASGFVEDELLDVNEHNVAVGFGSAPDGSERSYIVDLDDGNVIFLPGVGGPHTRARRIDETGTVVGGGLTEQGHLVPLIWKPPYTSPQKVTRTSANAYIQGIADDGTLVGFTSRNPLTPNPRDFGGVPAQYHAVADLPIEWVNGTRPRLLAQDGAAGSAYAVNEAGTIVGQADAPQLEAVLPIVWQGDDKTILSIPGALNGVAVGLSDQGWITGTLQTAGEPPFDVVPHGFLWTGGNPRMLPSAVGPWDAGVSISHGVSTIRNEVTGWLLAAEGAGLLPTVWRCASSIAQEA